MAGHFLGHFDPSTVVELIRNPRGTEGVAADGRFDGGGAGRAPDHPVYVSPPDSLVRELACLVDDRAEEWCLAVLSDAGDAP